ncbi:MAG: DUF2207 domain-containing protein [Clostridia bacterium]|nr:DUF2207 domain-containing protein [Clostridia bacterium]
MFRKFMAALWALALLAPAALAGEAANYEISSYVMYMTVQPDGNVRVREEVIYSNPSAYKGFSFVLSLDGTDGVENVEAWADGEALEKREAEEESIGEARCFSVSQADGYASIGITAAGDNDKRTFACAYTLKGLAKRYEDTALLDRVLIPSGHGVMLQNAVAIVTLPRSDGEVLAYVDGAPEEIPLLTQYDTVNIGPLDVAADEQLSLQLVFPADWLETASTLPQRVRETVVAPREEAAAATERETNARRAEQYTAIAAYVIVFGALLLLSAKKYGIKGRMKAQPDEELLDQYPAALTGYVANDEASAMTLAGTLAELDEQGVLSIGREGSDVTMKLENRPETLAAHQAAALDVFFSDGRTEAKASSLNARADYDRAQAAEKRLMAYNAAVAADAHRSGLTWNNDTALIVVNLLSLLCGVVLGFVLLLVGKRMILEACAVAVFMFFLTNQFNRVRHLTDAGERLQKTAASLSGMADSRKDEIARHLAAAAALGCEGQADSDRARAVAALSAQIREAHMNNASLRRGRRKA